MSNAAQRFRHGRRADQRHRVRQIPQADRGQRLSGRARSRAPAGRERRQHARRQHGRGHARFRSRHGHLPQSARRRAGHLARADHDQLIEMVGDRGGAEMRARQVRGELDQPEGGRGALSRARQEGPPLRRRRGGDGLRRAGAGRDRDAQIGDLQARLQALDREGRLPAGRHHLRSQHLRRRHRHRGAQQLRPRLYRGHAPHQGRAALRARVRRRVQSLLRLPRQ